MIQVFYYELGKLDICELQKYMNDILHMGRPHDFAEKRSYPQVHHRLMHIP